MKNAVILNIDEKKYPLGLIKETAYLLSGDFWLLIKRGERDSVRIIIESMNKKNIKNLKKEFFDRLKEEKIKNEIFEENIKFREYLIKQAMTYQPEKNDTDGLTQEEERELEKLIKEVEDELKKESGGSNDSEIKKTWEEKYGGKTSK